MRQYFWHLVTITSMVLVGIGFFLFSLFSSNPTKPEDEIVGQFQLSERHPPQIQRAVCQEKRKSEPAFHVVEKPISEGSISTADFIEEQEEASSSLPVSRSDEEDAVNAKIKELEAQLASYWDKMRVLDKRREEIREQIRFHGVEGLKEMQEEHKMLVEQLKEAHRLGLENEKLEIIERIKQLPIEFNRQAAALGEIQRQTLEEHFALEKQIVAIREELNHLKSLRQGEAK